MKYQYPNWSKFLFKRFNFLFEFKQKANGLEVIFGNNDVSAPISELPRSIEITQKFFWSELLLTTTSNTFSFKILNSHRPHILLEAYQEYVTNFYRTRATKTLPNLLELYENVRAFLQPKKYIKTSSFKCFMKDKNNFNLDIEWMYEFCTKSESESLKKLHKFFENPFNSFEKANERFVKLEIEKYRYLIDVLNESQQKACIINDDTNLILAGAGTGKTKTLEVRTDYLIKSQRYRPEEILLIAFGKKAKNELITRVGKPNNVEAVTFHGFGRSIVEGYLGKKVFPDVLANDKEKLRKFLDDEIQRLLTTNEKFVDLVITYFDDFLFPYKNPFDFKSLGEYYEYIKTNEIRSFSTDKVKSFEEVTIANFLYRNNIKFEYEKMYKGDISKSGFMSYHPDFYLPEYDVYIEHFGVDKNLEAPEYMNPKKYKAGIYKKREIHKENNTDLIETFSYMQREGKLLKSLKDDLDRRKVQFNPIPKDEYLEELRKLGAISQLAELSEKAIGLTRTMNHDVESLKASLTMTGNISLLAAIDVLEPLLFCYEHHLKNQGTVDFNSMINDAIGIIRGTDFICGYKVIMVDEYQDISGPRAEILLALQERDPELIIYGVGDDRQAIYRFTGSDLSFTYNFFQKFGEGKKESLAETYRFNDKINKVATRFISANKKQNDRDFIAKPVDDARVHIVSTSEKEQQDKINDVINWISRSFGACSILLLNRYSYKKPKYFAELEGDGKKKSIKIEFSTCHSSKGREADFVILMDMEKGKNGFPAEKIEHPLIEFLLPEMEIYEFAEERRLFYVALTRAKERVFILSNEENCSDFVKEIRKYGEKLIDETTIEPSLLALNVTDQYCPKCETGRIIKRGNGSFSTCSNQPLCNYKTNNCKGCGGPRKRVGYVYVCMDISCNTKTPTCPACDGDLRPTNGVKGRYWGCYRGWNNCKGSQDWSIYKDDPDVYVGQ
uniref:DNA 3'-5' helicase n=1 Tax=Rheinheimera sp. BAL341 TaxID=1708203 RepID=A0A486XL09_9GAMM